MDSTKNRILVLGGGHVAALTLLLLSACGPGGGHDDSGQPIPDAGPMADEGVDMPDANVPPGDSGDMMPDLGTDAGVDECTAEMLLNRVTPPCDPDTRTGAAPGPTGMEGLVGPGMRWFDGTEDCTTNTGADAMGRVWLVMACSAYGTVDAPFVGTFYYDLDGKWYFNWKNRSQQVSARMSFDTEHRVATIELFHAVESVPYLIVTSSR
jgi:hypothetical protein